MKITQLLCPAAAMLVLLTACAESRPETADAPRGILSHTCSAVPLTKGGETDGMNLLYAGDKLLLGGWRGDGEDYSLVLVDPSDRRFMQSALPDVLGVAGAARQEDCYLLLCTEHAPDGAEYRYTLLTLDDALSVEDEQDVTALWGEDTWVYDWCRLTDGTQLVTSEKGLRIVSPDGTVQDADCPGAYAKLCISPDDTVWVVPDGMAPHRLDRDTLQCTALGGDGLPREGHNDGYYADGEGDYALLYSDGENLCGIRTDDVACDVLVDLTASGFAKVSDCAVLENGQYAVWETDTDVFRKSGWLLTPRTQEEAARIRTVDVAAVEFYQDDMARINRFNRQSQDAQLVVHSYADEEGSYERAQERFEQDLLAGVVPDMVLLRTDDKKLSNKGLFEDLYSWMAQDPDFREEDYFMPVLGSTAYKGRLECVSFRFCIDSFAAQSGLVSGLSADTPSALLGLQLPEGMTYFADDTFEQIVLQRLGSYVDYETGTCSFDSPEVVALLELSGTTPKEGNPPDEDGFMGDRALLCRCPMRCLMDLRAVRGNALREEDIRLLGIDPSGESSGIVYPIGETAVLASSENKDLCWEFIRFCLNEENQYREGEVGGGFPVHRAALERKLAYETREGASRGYGYYAGSIPDPTQEDARTVRALLEGELTGALIDDALSGIVREEAGKYIAGDCTAQEAADAIQRRAQLYLSEQS
ncbi:MAG: hypothetical protein IJ055_05735 [Oscillospiraceae bacterium]|nr:hypothetical protein [Oscillospiraceae bacterium]